MQKTRKRVGWLLPMNKPGGRLVPNPALQVQGSCQDA